MGYQASSTNRQAWGTNHVESSSAVAGAFEGFNRVGTTATYEIEVNGRNVAAQAFDFDDYSFDVVDGTPIGGGGNEVQAAASDSGSGVYSWNGAAWELNGVMHSIGCYINCNQAAAIRQDRGSLSDLAFGDLTVFSDFSLYHAQINAYLAPPEGFEFAGTGEDTRFFHLVDREFGYNASGDLVLVNPGLWGDINLDGQVSGDGTGAWESDDITAFVDGWGSTQSSGDIFSWKRGDLNQDGRVTFLDFALLRSGLNSGATVQIDLAHLLAGEHSCTGTTQCPAGSLCIVHRLVLLEVATLVYHAPRWNLRWVTLPSVRSYT